MTFPRAWLGAAPVLAAAVLLSSTSVSAVVSYGGDANPSAAIVVRFIGAVIVLYGLPRFTGTPMRLERRERLIAIVGSVRAGLIMNFEPVASVVLAYAVLGQTLTPLQLAGGALVISALIAARWDGRRSTGT